MKKNFLTTPLEDLEGCHDGVGVLKHSSLFVDSDFQSAMHFMNYTVLPPETSIGLHTHKNDEEFYVILSGTGVMTVNGEKSSVSPGDVYVNPPFGTHMLENTGDEEMRVLVFEVKIPG